jgi:glutamate racemase
MTKIGIYDSGCGGFSVLNHLLKSGYTGDIYYYGDTKNTPWGSKTKKQLNHILNNIAQWFKQNEVSTIISGCNTTLGVFSNELTTIFSNKVINVLENTQKNYDKEAYSVLLTENSFKHNLFSKLIKHCSIQEIPCPGLAKSIEMNKVNDAIQLAKIYIAQCHYQHIILGCTHYPLIIQHLRSSFPEKKFIDPTQFFYFHSPLTPNKIHISFKITGDTRLFNELIENNLLINDYLINGKRYKQSVNLVNQ